MSFSNFTSFLSILLSISSLWLSVALWQKSKLLTQKNLAYNEEVSGTSIYIKDKSKYILCQFIKDENYWSICLYDLSESAKDKPYIAFNDSKAYKNH